MSDKGKKKHRISKWMAWSALVTFFGVTPGWIFIGGIDCAPPDDADLIIPLGDKPFESDGNGWVMLSNVLSQVDEGAIPFWNQLALDWYAHPEWNHVFDDPDVLACFTNAVTGRAYVETSLKSNEVLLAGIDAAIAAPTYAPPLTPHDSMINGEACLPLSTLFDIHRGVLPARVKCAVEKGDFDAAIEYFGRSLRLNTRLQTRCNSFVEFCVGSIFYGDDVALLEEMLDNFAIPVEKLRQFDALLKDLPGFSPEAMAYALKLNYSYDKAMCNIKPVDIVFPGKSGFTKLLLSPIARYDFHPNRVLCAKAKGVREALRGGSGDFEKCMSCWHARRRSGLVNAAKYLIPNSLGDFAGEDYKWGIDAVKGSKEMVLSVRQKIVDRINIPQPNDEPTVGSRYFPLVFTNGCYYTHDLKKIVGRAQ